MRGVVHQRAFECLARTLPCVAVSLPSLAGYGRISMRPIKAYGAACSGIFVDRTRQYARYRARRRHSCQLVSSHSGRSASPHAEIVSCAPSIAPQGVRCWRRLPCFTINHHISCVPQAYDPRKAVKGKGDGGGWRAPTLEDASTIKFWRSTPSHLGSGKSSGRQSQPQTRRTGARPRWLLPAASMSTVSCASALSFLSERLSD